MARAQCRCRDGLRGALSRAARPDGRRVKWDTSHLFEYEALLEAASRRKRYKRNVSASRTSLQIKFDITLKVGDGALADRTTVQLIWMGRPDGIGLELRDDLDRLAQASADPVQRCPPTG